jgi:5-methyltetrahydrofolate--homocysteine methyltransferase
MNNNNLFQTIQEKVVKGKSDDVISLCQDALSEFSALDILNEGLLPAMNTVAEDWRDGKAFIPEVLIASRALNFGLEVLEPHLAADDMGQKGKVVIGTVMDDLHDIGKNIIALMLKSKGFEVIDLGVNVKSETFVEAVRAHQPKALCMSALLTTSMIHFKDVIKALKDEGLREGVLVCVGGAPVTEAYSQQIGADIFETDAISFAYEMAKKFS